MNVFILVVYLSFGLYATKHHGYFMSLCLYTGCPKFWSNYKTENKVLTFSVYQSMIFCPSYIYKSLNFN